MKEQLLTNMKTNKTLVCGVIVASVVSGFITGSIAAPAIQPPPPGQLLPVIGMPNVRSGYNAVTGKYQPLEWNRANGRWEVVAADFLEYKAVLAARKANAAPVVSECVLAPEVQNVSTTGRRPCGGGPIIQRTVPTPAARTTPSCAARSCAARSCPVVRANSCRVGSACATATAPASRPACPNVAAPAPKPVLATVAAPRLSRPYGGSCPASRPVPCGGRRR